MIGIRGATTINEDSEEEIIESTSELINEIISSNCLDHDRITAIFFTCTRDIMSAYPAAAARHIGFIDVPLMCFQEMYVAGSLEKCIRVCVFYDEKRNKKEIRHIYLKEASKLRPDLCRANVQKGK